MAIMRKNIFPTGGPMGKTRQYTPRTRGEIRKKATESSPNNAREAQMTGIYDDAKDYANWWYDERATQDKYKPQLPDDALQAMKDRLNNATYDTSRYGDKISKAPNAFRTNAKGAEKDAAIRAELMKPSLGGLASPEDGVFWTKRMNDGTISHEGIGHMAGDMNNNIMRAVPYVPTRNELAGEEYNKYSTQPNERNAQTWDFRYENRNLKDDNGNYYIDPNRQLTPEDMKQMREKGAKLPPQWESNTDDDIIKLHNTIADTGAESNPFGTNMAAYGGRLYGIGGLLSGLTNANKAMGSSKMGGLLGGASGISGLAGGVASAASNAISGGMSTGVGGAMQAIGGIASNIPGVGGLIGAGVNVLGGLVNRAFGSSINEEFVNETKAETGETAGKQFDNSSIDSVIQQQMEHQDLGNVQKSQVGKDGWFSKKAKKLTESLNKQRQAVNAVNKEKINLALEGADEMQDLDLLANFAAYGGPLFADGGFLGTHGGDFSNGITIIREGGTHEGNPNEGVQMGIDPQGTPNLVEEGEVVFNDYVFSNRLKVPKRDRKRLRLREGTFANAAEKLQKESAERSNDPISKRGLETSMSRLARIQERIRERKRAREKGNKFEDGGPYKTYKNFENIKDDWYTPEYMDFVNSLKEGDFESGLWRDRINSEEFGPVGGNKFTDISDIQRLATDRKKGPVHNAMSRAAEEYTALKNAPVMSDIPMAGINTDYESQIPTKISRPSGVPELGKQASSGRGENDSLPTWMRYAPVAGSAMGVINDAFRDTDYSNAESVRGSYQATPDIGFTPVGNKLTYRPLDTNYAINKLDANTAAQRRAITNTSGGNRATAMAGLLAANNNYGNQMGDLYRQAEEYNQAQKERVEGFNRQTNMYNSEGKFKADASNQQSRAANADRKFRNAATVAQMRQGIHDNDAARRDANISGLLQGLGDIGYENFGMNMANSNPALLYGIGKKGKVNKKKKGGRIVR